jgi:hypothetical protein
MPLFPPSHRLKEPQAKPASLIPPERLKDISDRFLAQPRPPSGSQSCSCLVSIQGGVDFSEGTSAKWVFDVEIEKFRSKNLFTCREDQNRALRRG